MRIIVVGDIHMALNQLTSIPFAEADLVILNGDLTNFGGRNDALKVIETVQRHMPLPTLLAQAGNLDNKEVAELLDERGINIHGKAVEQDGFSIVGLGGSNPTPFHTPTELSEEELYRLAQDAFTAATQKPTLFICHCPPIDTAVDRIASGLHVGSQSVRQIIAKFAPAICVCGHIHEAKGQDKIDNTRIYNPGMVQHGGWVEIDFHKTTGSFTATLH